MSTTEQVILAWLLLSLYCLIGVTFRFCCCVVTGEDPIDSMRPRRAMLRDALLWPLLAFLVVAIVVGEGLSIGGVAVEFRENARNRARWDAILKRHQSDPPQQDNDQGAA